MAADQEPGPLVQFRASDLYGQETVVECRPTDLVSAFCLRYEELKPHNQDALKTRFLYEGIELEKNMTLQSYNIDPAKPILVLNGPRSADENAPQAKAPNNYLIIITLYGWQTCVPIYDGDTTEILKLRIEALEGVPYDQQRVIANGKQLEDHRELNDYGLTTDGTSVAHLVLRLRGDIGLWDTHQDSWLVSALHKNAVADVPRDQVSEMVRVLKEQKGMALPSNASARKSESAELLSAPQREALIQQIDLALSDPATANTDWGAVTATSYGQFMRNRNDSQLFLKPVDIDRLLGVGTCDKLREAFGDSFNEVKVRRVVANDTCINFHLDYSLKTMAIPLNPSSEFKGGAIVFANEDGQLDMPSRAPGHALIHDNTWVHGVTRLSEGVRYSVFFLKTEEASA